MQGYSTILLNTLEDKSCDFSALNWYWQIGFMTPEASKVLIPPKLKKKYPGVPVYANPTLSEKPSVFFREKHACSSVDADVMLSSLQQSGVNPGLINTDFVTKISQPVKIKQPWV